MTDRWTGVRLAAVCLLYKARLVVFRGATLWTRPNQLATAAISSGACPGAFSFFFFLVLVSGVLRLCLRSRLSP
ncbi:hypothetical protein V8C34DRAFT_267737 [Trichoderma compactum]